MKPNLMKKSLLDYAIKGKLTAKFRRENPNLNAFEEIAEFNAQIRTRQKALQKELTALEKALKERAKPPSLAEGGLGGGLKTDKATIKAKIAALKKEFARLKEIVPLNSQNAEKTESGAKSPLPCESGAKSPPPLRRGFGGWVKKPTKTA